MKLKKKKLPAAP